MGGYLGLQVATGDFKSKFAFL